MGGATRVIHATDVTGLEFTADVDLAAGTYRVWLRAFNAAETVGDWGAAYEFTVA